MNSWRLFLAVTIWAFLAAFTVSNVHAGSMGNGAAQRQKLVVDSVDAAGGMIVLKSMADNSVHTYKITAATRITMGRAQGSIDQIKAGQKVANYRSAGGQAPQALDALMLQAAAPAPPANK